MAQKVKKGDVIVAGRNFGSGSSREHAPRALLQMGVSCVVAESYARILPELDQCRSAPGPMQDRGGRMDTLWVDFDQGIIRNETQGRSGSSTRSRRSCRT